MAGLFKLLKKIIVFGKKKANWRAQNYFNNTRIGRVSEAECISVGIGTYGCINAINTRNTSKLVIGNYCSIADDVVFVVCSDHPLNYLSTFPFKSVLFGGRNVDALSKGDIVVDDDVWIGYGATILSGVHIGQGAVVAAGAVVSKDVSPYTVVGGVPAKVIKHRFSQPVIDYLITFDYGALTEELARSHIDVFYKPIDVMKLEEIMVLYDWFPKNTVGK